MTVRDALREGTDALSGTETAFLDASLLLAGALGRDRTGLLASLPEDLGEAPLKLYRSQLKARAGGLPVAYLLGYKEFWGRRFAVDPRVLVPRPDTETLVAAALESGDRHVASAPGGRPRVHECCCGSGCVAISVAAERPLWLVSASDLSEAALEVARANAAALLEAAPGPPMAFLRSDLLGAVPGSFDLILANPPYVPSKEAASLLAQGWEEPLMALDGGEDGLDLVRRLVAEAATSLAPGGELLVEGSGEQAPSIAELFRASRLTGIETLSDLGGQARVTRGRKAWGP